MCAARELELQRSSLVSGLFALRAFLTHASYKPLGSGPFLQYLHELGWSILAEDRDGLVFGTVTKPWEGNVVFRPVEPSRFAAFAEPGYAKIAWTIRVEPRGRGSCCITETRVATTSPDAERRFRRYWAVFSPGIVLIRLLALQAIKRAAQRSMLNERHWFHFV